ncbi:uncharacterized protein LOC117315671 [Pecten maximus]|uniref:uncharacterized protein LOC117315671 n=1 Tax=Pecten maximus TaxID=6579 RepID=UPI0014582DAE|nr:uncharacterized protein LOC117315671 [Pecten maximus]
MLMRKKQTGEHEEMDMASLNSGSTHTQESEEADNQQPEPQAPPKKKVCRGKQSNKENESEKEKKKEALQRQKEVKEKKKAETEKKKAETEKKKAEEIRRNSSFLQSLEAFKNTTTPEPAIETRCQPVSLYTNLNTEPPTFMESNRPRAVLQPSVIQPVESQLSSPHYMDLVQMPQLHFTPRPPRRISNEDQHSSRYSSPQWESTPVSRMLNDARETLHTSYDQEGGSDQCFTASCALMREELRTAHDNLKVLQSDNRRLEEMLWSAREEIETLKNGTSANRDEQSTCHLQADGRPRAGRVPSASANAHHMVELLPGTGVYVYPKHITTAKRKQKGTQVARYLMSVFYTNTELVDCGNVTGCHGKKGMDKTIVNTIEEYAVSIHGRNLLSEVKFSMRTKISALVSLARK